MPRSNALHLRLSVRSAAAVGTLLALFSVLPRPLFAQTADLKWKAGGIVAHLTTSAPTQQKMSATRPDTLKKIPKGIPAPLYATLKLGPRNRPTVITVVLDNNASGPTPRLWVDANANGDLTDDAPLKWKPTPYPYFDGTTLTRWDATVRIPVRYEEGVLPLPITITRWDKRDLNHASSQDMLLYQGDFGREGTVTLGTKTFPALLIDVMSLGDFRPTGKRYTTSSYLILDVNGNGKIDPRGEIYPLDQPFNIGGTTWEVANLGASGDHFTLRKSAQVVDEIPAPPDLGLGKPALAFVKTTMDGKTVRFPEDYRSHLVLLYFWAAYCPKCQAQISYVTQAFAKYHAQGLEVLGVSADFPDDRERIVRLTQARGMTWPQIYEGKSWQSELIMRYNVLDVPSPFLIDGDTGRIVAMPGDLLGDDLDKTLARAFAAHKSSLTLVK